MEVPSPWDSPSTWVKSTALPGRSRHSPGTSMVSTPSWGHLTVALVCIAQSGTLTTREHIKCPSTNHSKRTCGSSKLAGLGTAGGPTTAVPTQARRAAECWGAAWGASCPVLTESCTDSPTSHCQLLQSCRLAGRGARRAGTPKTGTWVNVPCGYNPRLGNLHHLLQQAAPLPRSALGWTCPKGLPGEESPTELSPEQPVVWRDP